MLLKILLVIVAIWVAVHLLPIVLVALLIVGVLLIAMGAFGAGGFALAAGLGLTLVGVHAATSLVLLAVLSPIWIPILALIVLIALTGKLFDAAMN